MIRSVYVVCPGEEEDELRTPSAASSRARDEFLEGIGEVLDAHAGNGAQKVQRVASLRKYQSMHNGAE